MFYEFATMFLNHFQFPICYDVVTKLLANFEQDKATHISDQIQVWHRRKILIKDYIFDEFLLEQFLKSLQLKISKDVSLLGVFTEKQVIFRAQELELIYSKYGVLYKILPNSPRLRIDLAKPKIVPHVDKVVGSIDSNMASLIN